MWRRLLHPTLLRPAASAVGLGTLSSFQPGAASRNPRYDHSALAPSNGGAHVLRCSPKQNTWNCSACDKSLPRDSFALRQRNHSTRVCKACSAPAQTLTCTQCHEELSVELFARSQRERSTRICSACCAQKVESCPGVVQFLVCSACGEQLPRQHFAARQQNRSTRTCSACTLNGGPPDSLQRIALGALDNSCKHCGANVFACEVGGFCCGQRKHFVDFGAYFKSPGEQLLTIFASTWHHKDAARKLIHDATTDAPKLTSFPADSRRYNNLFSLAMHEIHSTTSDT